MSKLHISGPPGMTEIDPSTLTRDQRYKLLTGLVVPRPIAWVSTLSLGGKVNLAPFSAFTFVSQEPPMVLVSFGRTAGVLRQTGENILRSGEFVVNIADQSLLGFLHDSSANYPPEESEADALELATAQSSVVAPPRVASAPAALECRLHLAIPFGREQNYSMIGEVLRYHVRPDLLVNDKISTRKLDPVGRIAGPTYAQLGEMMTLPPAMVRQVD
jgi:flavin reductase (DIM6/NTAB) family NADH-FMN oxidoreductase RutF